MLFYQPFNFLFLVFLVAYDVLYSYYGSRESAKSMITNSIFSILLLCAIIARLNTYSNMILVAVILVLVSTVAILIIGISKLKKKNDR